MTQLWPKLTTITAKQTVSRKTQPIRRPLSLCSSVAALRPDMLTCDNMFISLKDSEELPLSLLRGLWWLALERSAAVTTEQHGLERPDDEVNEPPICWWVWKMKHNCQNIISQNFFNVSFFCQAYAFENLKIWNFEFQFYVAYYCEGTDDEVNEPPICWWVWKMKHNCQKSLHKISLTDRLGGKETWRPTHFFCIFPNELCYS